MGANTGKHSAIPKSSSSGSYSNNTGDNENSSSDENDGPSPQLKPGKPAKKGSKKGSKKRMPLFRKQSDKARKRSEHQQYLAQEDPEPVFDLSHCELEEVPSGVFPLCKVLQKEVILLNDNWLRSFPDHFQGSDLRTVRVLDLHNNELRSVPDEIGGLSSLQVFNVENNRIHKLPPSLGRLTCLQTLNVKGNKLKVLPQELCTMKCLRMLDISENNITALPKQLCNVRTLETLTLDAGQMTYPQPGTCSAGTEEIMKFLCSECGLEYLPPSNFLLDILEPPKPSASSPNSDSINKVFQCEEDLRRQVESYSNLKAMKDRKRMEQMEYERMFAEQQHQLEDLALIAANNREKMISVITKEEKRMERELEHISHDKEKDRQRLIQEVKDIEDGAESLIERMLDMNTKAKKAEELLDEMEQERIKKDELFVVRWEEEQNLRKNEVLDAMQKVLKEFELFESARQNFTDNRENTLQRALEDEVMMSDAQVESVLVHKDIDQTLLMEILSQQEKLQKDAFEALQLQKDAKHKRITQQISLIQEELASLTVVEMERREYRMEEELNRLAEKRIALIDLLSTLMFERESRQQELRHRLEEMEQQRQDGQTDYWLVQYQRLMDRKPKALIDQERQLEISVLKILEQAEAQDYIPIFARHRISIETMLQMSEDDLKQMGIHELGVRKNILRNLEVYHREEVTNNEKPGPSRSRAPPVGKSLTVNLPSGEEAAGASSWPSPSPSAPPLEDEHSPMRQTSIMARGLNSECSICLDKLSEVIFLNCGHVCCCVPCSELLQQCPLCRADIVRRIKLIPTQPFSV